MLILDYLYFLEHRNTKVVYLVNNFSKYYLIIDNQTFSFIIIFFNVR